MKKYFCSINSTLNKKKCAERISVHEKMFCFQKKNEKIKISCRDLYNKLTSRRRLVFAAIAIRRY